ncbi:MAG: ATP-binding cassette domain-containing protein [Acidimicrobiales bacterium]
MNPTVEFVDLRKRFGSTVALDGVTARLEPGITGLLGPNGAGKTTLLRILATVLAADNGELRLLGQRPNTPAALRAIRQRLGYCPQEPGFYGHFSAFDFVDYIAILKELDDRTARRDEVRRVLTVVGLEDVMHKKIRTLSGGMRRRVAIAQSLIGEPELLVLDEPTAGLDPELRLRFREVLSRRRESQVVVLSTHQTDDIAAMCQRVIVIDGGSVRFDGTPAELAARAAGHVWVSDQVDQVDPSAKLSWIDALGQRRHIGTPPDGATLVSPTIDDAYLLLVGRSSDSVVGA